MTNFVVTGIILMIFGLASMYIYKEKKRGVKCIGCPSAGTCASRNAGASGCGCGCMTAQ